TPPPQPVLEESESNGYSWHRPGFNSDAAATVLFENGTPEPVTVKLDDKDAFLLPALGKVFLSTTVESFSFSVTDKDGGLEEQVARTLKPHGKYVYNHMAAWDYQIETRSYSSHIPFGEEAPFKSIAGTLFFELEGVGYFFDEPFPDHVTVTTATGFGSATLARLNHLTESPHCHRPVKTFSRRKSDVVRCVDVGNNTSIVQSPATASCNAETHIFLDNAFNETIRWFMDDAEIARVSAGASRRIQVEPGSFDFSIANENGEVIESIHAEKLEHRQIYIWSPGAMREYILHIDWDGVRDPDEFRKNLEESLPLRGMKFFNCPDILTFKPFPYDTTLSTHNPDYRFGTIEKGAIHDSAASLASELDELVSKAGQVLDSKAMERLSRRLSNMNQASLTDLDLWPVRAAVHYASGEAAKAYTCCTAVILFDAGDAEAFGIRGRLLLDQDFFILAANDLTDALRLDPTLEPELGETLAKAKKLRDDFFKGIED
ncbi:MAG: hypothetical protein ABIK28_19040, partial [Planctomycetota bacterium]